MTETVVLGESGRIVLPASIRKEFGLAPGERLTVFADSTGIRMLTRKMALESIRAELQKHIPPGVSLADELIRERREEVRREDEEYRGSIELRKAIAGRRTRKSRG